MGLQLGVVRHDPDEHNQGKQDGINASREKTRPHPRIFIVLGHFALVFESFCQYLLLDFALDLKPEVFLRLVV